MSFVTDRGPATPDGSPRTALRRAALALATGLAAFAVGIVAESAIIHAVHGTRRQLEWVSDALISTALAGIAYLWLHLRGTRIQVLALEQERIAVNEQLRLAAEIQRGRARWASPTGRTTARSSSSLSRRTSEARPRFHPDRHDRRPRTVRHRRSHSP